MVPSGILKRSKQQQQQFGLVTWRFENSTNKDFLREQRAEAPGHTNRLEDSKGRPRRALCHVLPLFVSSSEQEPKTNFGPESLAPIPYLGMFF